MAFYQHLQQPTIAEVLYISGYGIYRDRSKFSREKKKKKLAIVG